MIDASLAENANFSFLSDDDADNINEICETTKEEYNLE